VSDLLAVDVDDLAVHLHCRVHDPRQHVHGLEDLKRTWLHTNDFRVLRRLRQRIDNSTVDAPSGQFDGGGEADGAGAGDEDLRLRVFGTR
jgi:hypothetical protein